MAFLVFLGFCVHRRPGKLFFEARKVPPKIFFRWWLCTLLPSLCKESVPCGGLAEGLLEDIFQVVFLLNFESVLT